MEKYIQCQCIIYFCKSTNVGFMFCQRHLNILEGNNPENINTYFYAILGAQKLIPRPEYRCWRRSPPRHVLLENIKYKNVEHIKILNSTPSMVRYNFSAFINGRQLHTNVVFSHPQGNCKWCSWRWHFFTSGAEGGPQDRLENFQSLGSNNSFCSWSSVLAARWVDIFDVNAVGYIIAQPISSLSTTENIIQARFNLSSLWIRTSSPLESVSPAMN